MSTNNNTQGQQNTQQSRNPFGSRTNSSNQNSNNSPFGNPPPGSSSRFGSGNRLSRFGRTTIDWTVVPLHDRAVRFSLAGLGDPFQRLLGLPLDMEMRSIENIVKRLQADKSVAQRMEEALDEIWQVYSFQGAALLFPYEDGVRRAYIDVIQPVPAAPQQEQSADDDDDYEESEEASAPEVRPNVMRLRAIDLGLVLNVLARSRANVLVGNTPLALEAAFLQQTFICGDPRIVAIAEATGSIEDAWE